MRKAWGVDSDPKRIAPPPALLKPSRRAWGGRRTEERPAPDLKKIRRPRKPDEHPRPEGTVYGEGRLNPPSLLSLCYSTSLTES
ncbi:unnamed protein product [Arctogadus glacialis]